MTESCTIKSNSHGITLILNSEVTFETLVTDMCKKFLDAKEFFGAAELILTIEGRELTPQEVAVVVEAIELNSDIKVKLIHENNRLKDIRMQGQIERFYYDNIYENAHIVMDSVKSNENLVTDQSVIILGDVKDGGSVQAKGNVIVFGELLGSVHAGYPDENSCYIIAGAYDGREVSIGTYSGQCEVPKVKHSFFHREYSHTDALAIVVYDDELTCEAVNRGIFKEK